MNTFDYAVVAAIAVGALSGMRRGLLGMLTAAASVIIGLYLASLYYGPAAALAHRLLGLGETTATLVGWMTVFVIVFVAIESVGATVIRVLHLVHLGWLDRLAGAAIGAGLVAVVCGLGVMLLTALLPADASLLRNSKLAPMLLTYNQTLVRYIPQEVRDEYELNRRVLIRYWIEQATGTDARATEAPVASPSPAH